MNYRLDISYDGSAYSGFQTQINHVTVQRVLENRLAKVLGRKISVNASGRTDAGVHALGQTINFKADINIAPERLQYALNNALPGDIVVLNTQIVDDDFHARFSAIGKTYAYKILYTRTRSPFVDNYCWQIDKKLDVPAIHLATKMLIGEHDFASFRSAGSVQGSAVRSIYDADWKKNIPAQPLDFARVGEEYWEFIITGNGFLYHMVRNIVGTLVQVGLGKMSLEEFERFFLSCKREGRCFIAPPQGLYLVEVMYA